jgi:hypothetical protein
MMRVVTCSCDWQRLAIVLALALAVPKLAGCSSGGSASTGCIPGVTQACLGPGRCQGAQVCASDGKSFGVCDCGRGGIDAGGGNNAAGAADGGGAGGSGGAAGGLPPDGTLRLEAPKAVPHLAPLNQPDAAVCSPDGYCTNAEVCETVAGAMSDTYACCPMGATMVASAGTYLYCDVPPPTVMSVECCPAPGATLCGTSSGQFWCCSSGSTCGASGTCVGAQATVSICKACGTFSCGPDNLCDVPNSKCEVATTNIFAGLCPPAEPVDCGGPGTGPSSVGQPAGKGCCGAGTQCCAAGQCCPTGHDCCGDGKTCCPPGTTCSGTTCITTGTGNVDIVTSCPPGFPIDCGSYCCNFGSCCAAGCCP